MLRQLALSLMLPLLLAGAAPMAVGEEESGEARLRLKEASTHRRTSFKKPAAEKRRILLETAALYEAIIADCRDCAAECAEACFRAGEIYRTLDMTEKAEASFLRTLTFDAAGEFAARSLMEVGHIRRRATKYNEAVSFYERVLAECPAVRDECADAVTWIGKVQLKKKAAQKGRETLIGFAERFPEFPVLAIRNMDLAARSFIAEGRIDEARALVERCTRAFEANLGDNPRRDKKVKKALEKMKAPEELAELRQSASAPAPVESGPPGP